MNLEEKQELLKTLCEIQDSRTAPIELSIGWTDETGFTHDDIVITVAPPKIFNELIEKGYLLSIDDYGARVLTKSISEEVGK